MSEIWNQTYLVLAFDQNVSLVKLSENCFVFLENLDEMSFFLSEIENFDAFELMGSVMSSSLLEIESCAFEEMRSVMPSSSQEIENFAFLLVIWSFVWDEKFEGSEKTAFRASSNAQLAFSVIPID